MIDDDGVIRYDAGYGRVGLVFGKEGHCKGCGEYTTCVVADTSESEYEPATVCGACLARIMSRIQSEWPAEHHIN